jgi:hypothetical protein
LLRGDPEGTAELIDSLSFRQRYTSGVLSFTQEEAARLEKDPGVRFELIDSFEQDFLAPGMDTSRLALVWTQHRENDRTEIHFTIANVDLETGKRFAAYYDRADRTRLAAWQDYQNIGRGMDDPRAPERARAMTHDLKLPEDKKELADVLEKLIAQKAKQGELEDRSAVVSFIESKGLKVGRQGKDYITVIHGEGKNERFRLKGAVFHESFRFQHAVEAGIDRDDREDKPDRGRRFEQVRNRLTTAMQFRRDYLEKRYGRRRERVSELTHDTEHSRESMGAAAPEGLEMGSGGSNPRDISSVLDDGGRHLRMVEAGESGARSHEALGVGKTPEIHDRGRTDVDHMRGADDHGQARQQGHDVPGVQEGGVDDEHPDQRTGRPAHGLLAAIERGISAARSAYDRTVQELRGVIHDTIERASAGAKLTREALGRADSALRGHAERHAAALEAVGLFEQKARQAIKQIERERSRNNDRGR